MPLDVNEFKFEVELKNDERTRKLMELIHKSDFTLDDTALGGVDAEDINNGLKDEMDRIIAEDTLRQFGNSSDDISGKITFRNQRMQELSETIVKLQKISKSERLKIMTAANQNAVYQTNDEEMVEALKTLGVVQDVKENEKETEGSELEPSADASSEEIAAVKEKEVEEEFKKFAPDDADHAEDKTKVVEIEQSDKSKEEKDAEIKKYFETRYYLTGERVLEKIRETDRYKNMRSNYQALIDQAYLSCSDPSDLLDRDFLNKRMAAYLKVDETQGFEDIHMAALGNTYVGYHVEEVEKKEDDKESKIDESELIFPDFVDDMPQSIKDEARKEAIDFIEQRIRDIINDNNPYEAAKMLSSSEGVTEEALEDLMESMGDSKEATCKKVYLRQIQPELVEETERTIEEHKEELEQAKKEYDEEMQKVETMVVGAVGLGMVGAAALTPEAQVSALAGAGALAFGDVVDRYLTPDRDEVDHGHGMPGIN